MCPVNIPQYSSYGHNRQWSLPFTNCDDDNEVVCHYHIQLGKFTKYFLIILNRFLGLKLNIKRFCLPGTFETRQWEPGHRSLAIPINKTWIEKKGWIRNSENSVLISALSPPSVVWLWTGSYISLMNSFIKQRCQFRYSQVPFQEQYFILSLFLNWLVFWFSQKVTRQSWTRRKAVQDLSVRELQGPSSWFAE